MPSLPTVRLKVPGKNRVIKVNGSDYKVHQFGKYAGWLIVGDARGNATPAEEAFHARQSEIEMIRRNSDKSPASKDPQRAFERRAVTTPIGGGQATLDAGAPAAPPAAPPPAPAPAAPPAAERVIDRSDDFAQPGGSDGPSVDTNGVPDNWRDWRDAKKWLVTVGIVKKVTGIKPKNKVHAEALMLPYERGERAAGDPLPADPDQVAPGGGEGDA